MGAIYLASPYSHVDKDVVHARFKVTEFTTAIWLWQGLHIFSPIVYCHKLSKLYTLKTDAASWRKFNLGFIASSPSIFVLQLPGWEDSLGVTDEIQLANMLNIPVVHHSWQDVKDVIDNGLNKRNKSKTNAEIIKTCVRILEENTFLPA